MNYASLVSKHCLCHHERSYPFHVLSYSEWISEFAARHGGSVWMLCIEACEEMSVAFPELRVVRGIAVSSVSGKRWCHCWCVTPAGTIVDPTAAQFGGVPVTYEAPRSG